MVPEKSFWRNESGNMAVIAAVLLPALLGFAGLGTEAGLWYLKQQTLQSAADSAAVSAATANTGDASKTTAQADAVATRYGFVAGSDGTTITVNRPPKSGTHTDMSSAVEVIISQPQDRLISALWQSGKVLIGARAVALYQAGLGCVLALDPSASGAATTKGSANVTLNVCSLIDNSSSGTSVVAGGSSSIAALSVNTVGGISGTSQITTTNGVFTDQSATTDPYSAVLVPSYSGCNHTDYSAKNTVTLDPGVYCNGFSANAGAVVTLNPGIYIFDRGNFSVNGSATIRGSGVTLVFTSSTGGNWPTITINGGATIDLTPPSSGATAGIVVYGDRSMPTGTSARLNGGSTQYFGGAVYLPEAAVDFAGGASSSIRCTQLIGDTVTFSGNANLSLNCAGVGTKPLGSTTATLVE